MPLTFLPGSARGLSGLARKAIDAGRYLIFTPVPDGRAVLLLRTSPALIASVRRLGADEAMIVDWVRMAGPDHREHLAAGRFDEACADAAPADRPRDRTALT
ncbi:hypothetical protein BH11PSE6_BH11PSE6_06640 [soil metagenome]